MNTELECTTIFNKKEEEEDAFVCVFTVENLVCLTPPSLLSKDKMQI